MRCTLLVTGCLLLLAGCTSGSAPAASAPATPVPRPVAASTVPPPPSATSASTSELQVERVSGLTAFASPTANVLCTIATYGAACIVEAKEWEVSPKPASCDTDWGPDLQVTESGPASFRCGSDAEPYDRTAQRKLPYGRAIRMDQMQCESRRDGMRCDNLRTGHGFTVSRAGYTVR